MKLKLRKKKLKEELTALNNFVPFVLNDISQQFDYMMDFKQRIEA